MDAIRQEIKRTKVFFEDMKRARFIKGDQFSAGDEIIYHGNTSLCYSGSDFMPFVRRGILKIAGKEFCMVMDNGPAKVVELKDILEGDAKGLFYTRNKYEVVIDNWEEYIAGVLAE